MVVRWSKVKSKGGQLIGGGEDSVGRENVRGVGSAGRAPPSFLSAASPNFNAVFFRPSLYKLQSHLFSAETGRINGNVSTWSTTFPPLPLLPATIG